MLDTIRAAIRRTRNCHVKHFGLTSVARGQQLHENVIEFLPLGKAFDWLLYTVDAGLDDASWSTTRAACRRASCGPMKTNSAKCCPG